MRVPWPRQTNYHIYLEPIATLGSEGRLSPTEGSFGGAISYGRGTPVQAMVWRMRGSADMAAHLASSLLIFMTLEPRVER